MIKFKFKLSAKAAQPIDPYASVYAYGMNMDEYIMIHDLTIYNR